MGSAFRSIFYTAACAAALAASALSAHAQAFPEKPITMIIPYGAGGSHDLTARLMTSVLPQYLGQPVIVQLMPGAGGQIGTAQAAKNPADGYTLLYTHNFADTLMPLVGPVPYDSLKDFVSVARPSTATSAVVVRVDSPYDSLAAMLSYGRDNPRRLKLAHSGNWGSVFTPAAVLLSAENVEATFVPYQGGGPALQALLSGDGDFTFAFPSVINSQPQLKALMVIGDQKVLGEEVPTSEELGYADLGTVGLLHRAVLVHSNVPADRLEKLREAFDQMSQDPTYLALMKQMDEDVTTYMGGEEYEPLRSRQVELYADLLSKLTPN